MTSQTSTSAPQANGPQKSGQIIAVFQDRSSAQKLQREIESAGIAAQNITIDDHVEPLVQVAAMGTIVGAEAGLLIGAFFGGVIGIFAIAALSTVQHGGVVNSPTYRLIIFALTAVGAAFGYLTGKGVRASQPKEQKKKGDPYAPRTFRVVVNGSPNEIDQARRAVREAGA